MASKKDIVLFLSILLTSGIFLFGATSVNLPGTQAENLFCQIPFAGSLDYCSANAQPNQEYKLTSSVTVNSGEIADNSFKYKTSKASGIAPFSTLDGGLNILGEVRNARIDYVLKDSGNVIASERKRLGTVGSFETKDVTFESKVSSGQYEVTYIYRGDLCNFLGCSGLEDKHTEQISVPKLPLGEY